MICNDVTRGVVTADIKTAVKGWETELLEKLGIRWRDGRPHIHCPYPDHVDRNPSWRWDQRTASAVCTCLKSDIFGVAKKVKGINFGGAKLWIAEALGRQDPESVSHLVGRVKRFAQNHGIHDRLVAHPAKIAAGALGFCK